MPNFYVYLMSSLPFLKYGERSPFSFDHLLDICKGLIPEEDIGIIGMLKTSGLYDYAGDQDTLRRWKNFEISLKNELVKIRAGRRHVDPLPYLRATAQSDISINHIAINAHRAANPLESQNVLDQGRWHALDELLLGHYFDVDSLIVYACKLLILERHDRIRSANNMAIVEKALA